MGRVGRFGGVLIFRSVGIGCRWGGLFDFRPVVDALANFGATGLSPSTRCTSLDDDH